MSGINQPVQNQPHDKPVESVLSRDSALVELEHVTKHYSTPHGPFVALDDVSLTFHRGELVVVRGSSGSGKSTLLSMIAGLDEVTHGHVRIGGARLGSLSEASLSRFRGKQIGVVFQFFQLLPTLTVLDNLLIAMDLVGAVPPANRHDRARSLLRRVGVEDQADKLPDALSGGQQQRVALARALANDPPLILADEPTGNLDSATAAQIFDLLAQLAAEGKTVVVVTHESHLPVDVQRQVVLKDGRVARDEQAPHRGEEARSCTA